jgi:large subunit ribosomal protein L21
MYAVISDRNRQYHAIQGQRLEFDRNEALKVGDTVELPVLLLAGEGVAKVGTPFVDGAKAVVKVLAHTRGDKVMIGKYKRRKHMSNRRKGFKASYTTVEVVSISA